MKKLRPQEPDFDQIAKYIAGARKKLESARRTLEIDEEASYQLAYEAMLKASLGLMLSDYPVVSACHYPLCRYLSVDNKSFAPCIVL